MHQRPLSPEGKRWWDGQKWNPVEQEGGAQLQPPRVPPRRSRRLTTWVVASRVPLHDIIGHERPGAETGQVARPLG